MSMDCPAARVVLVALRAWRDAKCARIWTNVGTMDHGGYGCETSGDGYPDNPHDGSHDERCPVAIARANLFAAMDARTA